MSSYNGIFLHVVFGTYDRRPFLTSEIRPRVHAYMGGILNNLQSDPICIGGVEDHVHFLTRPHTSISPADLVGKVKSNSSRWIRQQLPGLQNFNWQGGYASFSVSYSHLSSVRQYIERQEEHHRRVSFEDELRSLLEASGIEMDPRIFPQR
ncbi:MAG TPA: IS200/IS605 family transposase [Thermoanaerobaculia bacterium]|nr:IS200/IS605 family transposase [Thermoanaerobaculia bacterium]